MGFKKYTTNELYFEKIDSRNKAYFLGLLYADGCIHKIKKYDKYQITINLVEGDCKVLELLKEDIEHTGPLGFWNKTPPRQNQKVLSIYSYKIAKDLISLGCIERKTNLLEYPKNLIDEYFTDFLRGFFDGDGTIAKVGSKNVVWQIIGLRDLLLTIKKKLELLGFHPYIVEPTKDKYYNKDLIYLKITRKKEIFYLMNEWYNNTNLYIDRKYYKWNQFFNVEKLHEYEKYGWNGSTGKNVCGKYKVIHIKPNGEEEIFNSMSHAGDILGISKTMIKYYCNKFQKTKQYCKNKPKICFETDYTDKI